MATLTEKEKLIQSLNKQSEIESNSYFGTEKEKLLQSLNKNSPKVATEGVNNAPVANPDTTIHWTDEVAPTQEINLFSKTTPTQYTPFDLTKQPVKNSNFGKPTIETAPIKPIDSIKQSDIFEPIKIAKTITSEKLDNLKISDPDYNAYIENGKNNKNNPYSTNFIQKPIPGIPMPKDVSFNLDNVSDEDKEYANYLYGKYGKGEADNKFSEWSNDKSINDLRNRSKTSFVAKNIEAPISNILLNTASPIYAGEVVGQNIKNLFTGKNDTVSENSIGSKILKTKNATEDIFTDGDDETTKFFKSTGLSIVNNIVNYSLYGGVSPYVMGMQSGASGAYEAKQNGANGLQQLLVGTAYGAAEKYFEGMAYSNLQDLVLNPIGRKFLKEGIKIVGKTAGKEIVEKIGLNLGKQTIKGIGKQIGVEFGEEFATEVSNIIADNIIMNKGYGTGSKSGYDNFVEQIKTKYPDIKQQDVAFKYAGSILKQTVLAGMAGAISGGVMGGGRLAMNAQGLNANIKSVNNEIQTKQNIINENNKFITNAQNTASVINSVNTFTKNKITDLISQNIALQDSIEDNKNTILELKQIRTGNIPQSLIDKQENAPKTLSGLEPTHFDKVAVKTSNSKIDKGMFVKVENLNNGTFKVTDTYGNQSIKPQSIIESRYKQINTDPTATQILNYVAVLEGKLKQNPYKVQPIILSDVQKKAPTDNIQPVASAVIQPQSTPLSQNVDLESQDIVEQAQQGYFGGYVTNENSSQTAKDLEYKLIDYKIDEVQRKNIIDILSKFEQNAVNSNVKVDLVVNIADEFNKAIKGDLIGKFNNIDMSFDGNTYKFVLDLFTDPNKPITVDFINGMAQVWSKMLQNNNSAAFKMIMKEFSSVDDFANTLTDYAISGMLPENVDAKIVSNRFFNKYVADFKAWVSKVVTNISIIRDKINKNTNVEIKNQFTAFANGDWSVVLSEQEQKQPLEANETETPKTTSETKETQPQEPQEENTPIEETKPQAIEQTNTPVVESEQTAQTTQPEIVETTDNETNSADPVVETKSKETNPTETKDKSEKLNDFGEKIGGARKDEWGKRGLLTTDLDEMNELEISKHLKKDNVWKKQNYQEMIDSGISADVVYFIKTVRDSLPASVPYSYKDKTPEQKRARQDEFIETINLVKDIVSNIKTKEEALSAFDKVLIENGYYYRKPDTGRLSYTEKATYNQSITNKLVTALNLSERSYEYNIVQKAKSEQFGVSKENKLPKGYQVQKFKDDTTYSVTKGHYIIKTGFTTEGEAISWLQETVKEKPKKGKQRFVPEQLKEIHRQGIDYRENNTKNVTGEDYLSDFNFKGGEFGNWLNENDRQTSLNYAYDALMDLADALGINKKDISFNKILSIAFGARGVGLSGAMAHYEPERKVMNLTKMNGAGSLAHEWGHALDYFIGEKLGLKTALSSDSKKLESFNNLINAMMYKNKDQNTLEIESQKSYERSLRQTETAIKNAFSYEFDKMTEAQKAEYEELKNNILNGSIAKLDRSLVTNDYNFGDIQKLSALKKSISNRGISKEDRQILYVRAVMLNDEAKTNIVPSQQKTDFYNNSIEMGRYYAKDNGYWDSTEEMFARAFASYITDKTNGNSNYLSGHSELALGIVPGKDGTPKIIFAFPKGEERTIINKAFDDFFAELKEKGILTAKEVKDEVQSYSEYSLSDEESGTEKQDLAGLENLIENVAINRGVKVKTFDDDTPADLSTQVDNWLDGKMKSSDYFKLGNTPVVLQKLGADNLPVVMTQDVMGKITGLKHDVYLDDIKMLPERITDPIMVFESATVPNAFVVLTEIQDKDGNDVVVAIHLNKWEKHLNINRISSVYGKYNIGKFVESEIEKGNLKYIDNKKSQEWLQSRGLQLPKLANTILNSNNNILQKSDIVNTIISKNNENDTEFSVDSKINAYYDSKTKTIYLNANANKPYLTLLGHELYHSLALADKSKLALFFRKNTDTTSNEFKAYKANKMKAYKAKYKEIGREFTEQDFWHEFTAENCETLFTNKDFIEKLSRKDRTLVQKILDFIRDMWNSLTGKNKYNYSNATKVTQMTAKTLAQAEALYANTLGVKSLAFDLELSSMDNIDLKNEIDSELVPSYDLSEGGKDIRYSISDDVTDSLNAEQMELSKLYDSMQKSPMLEEETKKAIAETKDNFYYKKISNDETIIRALAEINNDFEKALNKFLRLDPQRAGTIDIAKGFILLNNYQSHHDYKTVIDISNKLNELAPEQGRGVQIFSILGKFTPMGMLKYSQNEINKILKILSEEKGQKWVDANKDKFELTESEQRKIIEDMTKIEMMPDGRDKDVAIAELMKFVQIRTPIPASDKLKAFARISMLLNPKTVISRNFMSNVLMNPIFAINDFWGSGLDRLISKKTGVRTTGFADYSSQSKGWKQGAFESFDDFRRHINTRNVNFDKFDRPNVEAFQSGLFTNRTTKDGILNTADKNLAKALAALDRTTSFLLDVGDRPFFEGYFLESLNNQMKLNNKTVATPETIAIATQTGLEKTWQDDSDLTKGAENLRNALNQVTSGAINVGLRISGSSKRLGYGYGLGNIIMPFVKTPANLTRAVLMFSPLNLVKTIAIDARVLQRAIKNETVTAEMQRKFVDSFGKAITGTLITLLGLILFNMGRLFGADDEKDKDVKAFKRNVLGLNQYSVKLGNNSFTVDWLQPVGGILFTGGAIGKGTGLSKPLFDTLLDIASTSGNTLFDRSFMSGIQNFFGYDTPMVALTKSLMSAPAQMFSWQMFNQIGQIIDDRVRAVYTKEGIIQDNINVFKSRTPIVSITLEPQVDTLGQEVKRYGGKENIGRYLYNVLLNPANPTYKQETAWGDEIYRVYQVTGDKGIFPQVAPDSFKFDKVEYPLTGKDKTEFQKKLGQRTVTFFNEYSKTILDKGTDEYIKAELLKEIISQAKEITQTEYVIAHPEIMQEYIKENTKK